MKELTQRFTPVWIQSVHTSLFHGRRQGEQETVDSYAQGIKSLFYKTYPQAQQCSDAAESMGKSVLSSQSVAGLIPALRSKVDGREGGFNAVLVKARFKEAKVRDLIQKQPPGKPTETPPSHTVHSHSANSIC